jgi:hypothetical protein
MKWHSIVYACDKCLIFQESCRELSLEPTGRDGITSDPVFTKFGSERAGQAGEPTTIYCLRSRYDMLQKENKVRYSDRVQVRVWITNRTAIVYFSHLPELGYEPVQKIS